MTGGSAAVVLRGRRLAPWFACAIGFALLLDSNCAQGPDHPARANPFDPGNETTGGTPFQLAAAREGQGVRLTWKPAAVHGLSSLRVDRRSEGETEFVALDTLGKGEDAYLDETAPPDARSEYRVIAIAASGGESAPEASPVVAIEVPPHLRINPMHAGLDTTSVRRVRVQFFSERADTVFLSDSIRTEGGAVELVDATAWTPDPMGYDYVFPVRPSQGPNRSVYGRVRRFDGTTSPIASDEIAITVLHLTVTLDGHVAGPLRTGRRAVLAEIAASGADSMRIAFDARFDGPWEPFGTSRQVTLPGPDLDTLEVEVRNDFGVTATAAFPVAGDLLDSARIAINGDAAQTGSCLVTVTVVNGHALGICVMAPSELAAGADTCPQGPFQTFDGSVLASLDREEQNGFAHLYARLANEWMPDGTARVQAASIWLLENPAPCDGRAARAGAHAQAAPP